MDFRSTPEEETLRKEVREFVRREWNSHGLDSYTTGVYSYDIHIPEDLARIQAYVEKVAQRGWYTMHWPKEYGGREVPLSTQLAYREEAAYQGAPAITPSFIANTLMLYGQQWQKDYFLPRIAHGELEWSQGYSEPNAGTDLANLQTRAVRDGDDWLISGQKIWNTGGHLADWGHYLVRSDSNAPKHRGISYFLVDMKTPGVTLRPLYDALGRLRWCEVFLDNVRVPSRNLIGELNRGWYAAMTNMSFERSSIDIPARRLRDLEQFIAYCRQTRVEGKPLLEDTILRHQLAEARMLIEIGRMFSHQVAWLQSKGEAPVKESSFVKLFHSEMTPGIHGIFTRLLRESSVLIVGDPRAPLRGYPAVHAYLTWMGRFAGGGREIMLNIIAQRGLGLPR